MSKRRRGGAFFFVAAHVDVTVIGASIGQSVDQPRITVKGEDYRFVFGEKVVEVGIAQPVRMFAARLQFHQVDDVDDADF